MGLLSPAPKAAQQVKRVITVWRHACDRCGVSHDGSAISTARYKIVTPSGPIYLCRHHYFENCHYVLASGFPVDKMGED
jgi:hypothetical protein